MLIAVVNITKKIGFLLILVMSLVGCSLTEQLFQPVIEDRNGEVDEAVQEHVNERINQAWLDKYILEINKLSSEELIAEQEKNQAAVAEDDSEANRLKRLITALALSQPEQYEDLLLLIGDSKEGATHQPLIMQFLLKRYVVSIEQYQALLAENDKIVAEKRLLSAENKKVKTQLQTSKTEKTKLENQLKELKSIEASLIRRE